MQKTNEKIKKHVIVDKYLLAIPSSIFSKTSAVFEAEESDLDPKYLLINIINKTNINK